MGRRKNGEGTWGSKTIKGETYQFYRDTEGKYTYGRTIKEIKDKLQKRERTGFVLSSSTTFGQYITNWHNGRKGTIEQSTFDCYETMIKSMIIDFDDYDLDGVKLGNLSDSVFRAYLSALAKHYSHASIEKIWAIIKKCVKYGEVKKEIPMYSTFEVQVPNEASVAVKKKVVPFLSKEDAELFYQAAYATFSNGKLRFGINAKVAVFIMYSGLRVSECAALKWKNVDADKKGVKVVESFGEMKDRTGKSGKKVVLYSKSVKTNNSERYVPLPERATNVLIECEELYPEHKMDDYVFLSDEGTVIDRHRVSRTISAIAKFGQLSVPNISAHPLRHTYGSILLEEKVDIKKISELLGHGDIRTTYNIYIGVLDEDKRKEIERVFNKKEKKR